MDGNVYEKVTLREGLYCLDIIAIPEEKWNFRLNWIAMPSPPTKIMMKRMLVASKK